MKRRKRGPEGGEHLKGHVKTEVNKLMDNRHRLLAPFPFKPEEIHRLLWSNDEHHAIQVLLGRRDLLNTGRWFYIEAVKVGVDDEGRAICRQVYIKCNDLPMSSDNKLVMDKLPDEMREAIGTWAPLWFKLKQEKNAVEEKVLALAKECNTVGQIVRVWPELAGFLGDWARKVVDEAKVKSRYPDSIMKYSYDRATGIRKYEGIVSQFEPAAFEPLNILLAEALMLPFVEGEHVATVASSDDD